MNALNMFSSFFPEVWRISGIFILFHHLTVACSLPMGSVFADSLGDLCKSNQSSTTLRSCFVDFDAYCSVGNALNQIGRGKD